MSDKSFDLKLERARENLRMLDTEAREWINTKPCKSIDEPDPEPPPQPLLDGFTARRVRIVRIDPAPGRLSVLIGDCVFNLRSALDHIAFALAQSHTPIMSPRDTRNSEFPIAETLDWFNKMRNKISCIAPGAQAAIQALQPYNGANGYRDHPLWQIHELNIIDKHRRLMICAGFPVDGGEWTLHRVNVAEISYLIPSNLNIDFMLPEFNTVFVRWAGRPLDPSIDMHVKLAAPIEPSFGEGIMAAKSIAPALESLCDFVGDTVIATLAQFL